MSGILKDWEDRALGTRGHKKGGTKKKQEKKKNEREMDKKVNTKMEIQKSSYVAAKEIASEAGTRKADKMDEPVHWQMGRLDAKAVGKWTSERLV